MSYIVFARKYRPQNFDQIIGQEHISRTLKNAISENRVAHAYLFSGPRGVGKTTTARILAKSLNCKEGPTSSPCGKCANCLEITGGSSIDVQEIDGASNRGIDEIRSLRENVKFSPASSKYKVYIIDEAHQITDAAFNALLKTLEEPPSHVVFILATTEPQKIPLTILSRCQRYRYRLLSNQEIFKTLQNIVDNEKLKIEPEALHVITTAAGGSLRDALSLLDQAVSFVSDKVTLDDIQNLLGFLPKELIIKFTEALNRRDQSEILSMIKETNEQGYNLQQFARDLREHLRKVMLYRINNTILDLTNDEKQVLESQKSYFTVGWLVRAGQILSRSIDEMRWSDQPKLILELHMLKLMQPYESIDELINRLEKLEKGIPAQPAEYDSKPANTSFVSEKKENYVAGSSQDDNEPGSDFSRTDMAVMWNQVVTEVSIKSPLIANMFSNVRLDDVKGNNIVLLVGNKFHEQGLKRNQELIENIVKSKFNKDLGLKLIVDESIAVEQKNKEKMVVVEEESKVSPVKDVYKVDAEKEMEKKVPPGLDKVLNKFPGRISKKK